MILASSVPKKERVIAYIDGFNLYFGMRAANVSSVKWLDVKMLTERLLKPHQELVGVKYFTSRITSDVGKMKRQNAYLEAIEDTGVEIIYGKYQAGTYECKHCGHIRSTNSEKMTDVNIATHMLTDAFAGAYDCAFLISADSDLVPPISAITKNMAGLRVLVGFPPNRVSKEIRAVANAYFTIGIANLRASQLNTTITKSDGNLVTKPSAW